MLAGDVIAGRLQYVSTFLTLRFCQDEKIQLKEVRASVTNDPVRNMSSMIHSGGRIHRTAGLASLAVTKIFIDQKTKQRIRSLLEGMESRDGDGGSKSGICWVGRVRVP